MIIWLASYPRSGNTFLRTTLNSAFGMKSKSMHGDNFDIGGEDEFAGIVGHVKGTVGEEDVDKLRRDSEVHLIKTHHSPSHYMDVDDSVICIVRDGRDAVVSYYHYLKRIGGNRGLSLRDVAIGMAGFGLWSRHARDWESAQFRKRSVFRYEDMVKDNSLLIASLAEALGREPVSHEIPTFETLKGINSDFFRKGKVGSWADELNGADEKLFWLHNGSMMLRYGYDTQLPPDMEALVKDNVLTEYFEERSYNNKRDLEQFRRVLLRRDFAASPARFETKADEPGKDEWRHSARYGSRNAAQEQPGARRPPGAERTRRGIGYSLVCRADPDGGLEKAGCPLVLRPLPRTAQQQQGRSRERPGDGPRLDRQFGDGQQTQPQDKGRACSRFRRTGLSAEIFGCEARRRGGAHFLRLRPLRAFWAERESASGRRSEPLVEC